MEKKTLEIDKMVRKILTILKKRGTYYAHRKEYYPEFVKNEISGYAYNDDYFSAIFNPNSTVRLYISSTSTSLYVSFETFVAYLNFAPENNNKND